MTDRPNSPFDADTRTLLKDYLANLPNPVRLHVWGEPRGTVGEQEAVRVADGLVDLFPQIDRTLLPRRINYPYYPVIGVFGVQDGEAIDYGVRLIGLPAGMQLTSLIAAVQAVSFQGANLEARTRIQLSKLQTDVTLELLSSAEDEFGTSMAKPLFGLAVASAHIRSYLIMADVFPEALWKYSARHVPHLVINGRYHIDGELSENSILQQIAKAIQ